MQMELTTLGAPRVGSLPSGALDAITDVPGVAVGHCTLADGATQTGATVLLPQPGNLFLHKLPAGLAVINGFGKSVGLMQVQELGVLESPIALVNTLRGGRGQHGADPRCAGAEPELARSLPTLNPLVFECNDGWLNDARVLAAGVACRAGACRGPQCARPAGFEQGSVGAGRGMSCHGLKGGIGSASRRLTWQGRDYRLGALVLANQGRPEALTIAGRRIGAQLQARLAEDSEERGSIIVLLATDAPLDARQLARVARRAAAGLARTGSDYGHGSGDIALAFSTAWRVPQLATSRCRPSRCCTRPRSTFSFKPRPRPPSRRSCTRCLPPPRWPAATATCATRSPNWRPTGRHCWPPRNERR
jgi:D-aminopeptidase